MHYLRSLAKSHPKLLQREMDLLLTLNKAFSITEKIRVSTTGILTQVFTRKTHIPYTILSCILFQRLHVHCLVPFLDLWTLCGSPYDVIDTFHETLIKVDFVDHRPTRKPNWFSDISASMCTLHIISLSKVSYLIDWHDLAFNPLISMPFGVCCYSGPSTVVHHLLPKAQPYQGIWYCPTTLARLIFDKSLFISYSLINSEELKSCVKFRPLSTDSCLLASLYNL